LHRLASRLSSAASFEEVANSMTEFAAEIAQYDSCGVYIVDGENLIARSTQAFHSEALSRLKVQPVVEATGWVAGNRELAFVVHDASSDPRVKAFFNGRIEDRFSSFLSIPMVGGGRLVGVINLLGRNGHVDGDHEAELIATAGLLAGSEIERIRLTGENTQLAERLEARKVVERAKGILQRNLNLTEEDAYLRLQRESRQRRKSMKEVAEAIVLNEELSKKK
jgi:uroporphyrinogen-III synthase